MTQTTVTPRKALDIAVKAYILEAISAEGYENENGTPLILDSISENPKENLCFLYDTFKKEYGFEIARRGEQGAFCQWLMGLPSCFNIDFENYKILELARSWGSISPDLKGKALERREDLIIDNWFNFITVKTFQLFKKYKVN